MPFIDPYYADYDNEWCAKDWPTAIFELWEEPYPEPILSFNRHDYSPPYPIIVSYGAETTTMFYVPPMGIHKGKQGRAWLESIAPMRPRYFPGNHSWEIARKHFPAFKQACIDEFAAVRLFRKKNRTKSEAKCDITCLDARGDSCVCQCDGLYHGTGNSKEWYEVSGTTVVQDLDMYENLVGYSSRGLDPIPYDNSLRGVKYAASLNERDIAGWKRPTQYICSACGQLRARVWDHCHTHGYVRAPLCRGCNVRYFRGLYRQMYPGCEPNMDVSETYYKNCPDKFTKRTGLCSP
jgi:hypothetical protein